MRYRLCTLMIVFWPMVGGAVQCVCAQQLVPGSTKSAPPNAVKQDKAESLRSAVWGGRRSPMPVTESDPIFPLLVDHQKAVASNHEKRGLNANIWQFTSVDTPSCKELFPELRFVYYKWSSNPKTHDPNWSYTILERTLAIDPAKGLIVANFPSSDELLKLLIDHRIAIRDKADAKRVWHSYCEAHNRPWWGHGIERVSDSEWRLGVHKIERTVASNADFTQIETSTVFHSVAVNPDNQLIESWKYVSQFSGRRQVPNKERKATK